VCVCVCGDLLMNCLHDFTRRKTREIFI